MLSLVLFLCMILHQKISNSMEVHVKGSPNIEVTFESKVIKSEGGGSYDDTAIKEQLTELSADVSKLSDEVESNGVLIEDLQNTKIDKEADDYYPQLAVGLADNLSGVDVVDSEVNFRRSGGGAISDGVARIESIKGNSVVWNQVYKPLASVIRTQVINGVTFSVYEDGTIEANGTAEGSSGYITLMEYTNFLASHKYILIAIGAPVGKWSNQGFYFTGISGLNTSSMIGAEGYKIFQPSADGGSGLHVTCWEGYSLSCKFRPMFVDLTKAFPNDWQNINTIEEFYSRIPMGINEYAYNEGEVINMCADSIKTVGFNAWDEEWENGTYNRQDGKPEVNPGVVRCKNAIAVLPNMTYHFNIPIPSSLTDKNYMGFVLLYDADDNYIESKPMGGTAYQNVLIPSNARYMRFYFRTEYGTTYNNDICINISDASINGKYFPYIKRVEDLSIIRKYFPNGMKSAGSAHDEIRYNKASGKWEKVEAIGTRAYQDGDADNAAYLTDGNVTCYPLAEPIVTELDAEDQFKDLDYQVWNAGTEKAIAEGKSAPLAADITYGFNAIGKIKELEEAIKALQTKVVSL